MDIDLFTSPKCRVKTDGDKTYIAHYCDPSTMIEANKQRQKTPINKKATFRMVASVEPAVYLKILNETGIDMLDSDHWPRFRRLLNSGDWKWLKCIAGRV